MQLSDLPLRLPLPFANDPTARVAIPVTPNPTPGGASLTEGFPPLTRIPLAAGGIPPRGIENNGILYEVSAIGRWANAGGGFTFDQTFADAVAGYPKGARILRSDGMGYWFNTVEANTTDPNATGGGTGWTPDYTYGVSAITMTNANVTLTALQWGKPIIVITGVLVSNLNLIFPAITTTWTLINATTGAYQITAKTSGGSGIVVPRGNAYQIVGDGTNIVGIAALTTAYTPEQFGAAPTYSAGVNDTAFVNACFDAATVDSKPVVLLRNYSVTNALYGTQTVGASNSTSPPAMFGYGNETGFIGRSGTTGVVLQAWTLSGVLWSNFRVRENNIAGVTWGIDTEWKGLNTAPDALNRFENIWIDEISATSYGWNNKRNNQSPMYNCIVRMHSGVVGRVAFNQEGSGGQIVMIGCSGINGILDVTCQNAVIFGYEGHGIRTSLSQTGDNALGLIGCYIYSSTVSNSCIWTDSPGTAGHEIDSLFIGAGTLLGPVTVGDSLLDIALAGGCEFAPGSVVDSSVNWNLFGPNAVNKASGRSVVTLNKLAIKGAGVGTLTAVTGIDVEIDHINNNGTVQTQYNQVQTYTCTFSQATTPPTTGFSTTTAKYGQSGKLPTVFIHMSVDDISKIGTGEFRWSLPFTTDATVKGQGTAIVTDASTGIRYMCAAETYASNNVCRAYIPSSVDVIDNTHPITFANGDTIDITLPHPAA